jgi:hypothetical protein
MRIGNLKLTAHMVTKIWAGDLLQGARVPGLTWRAGLLRCSSPGSYMQPSSQGRVNLGWRGARGRGRRGVDREDPAAAKAEHFDGGWAASTRFFDFKFWLRRCLRHTGTGTKSAPTDASGDGVPEFRGRQPKTGPRRAQPQSWARRSGPWTVGRARKRRPERPPSRHSAPARSPPGHCTSPLQGSALDESVFAGRGSSLQAPRLDRNEKPFLLEAEPIAIEYFYHARGRFVRLAA